MKKQNGRIFVGVSVSVALAALGLAVALSADVEEKDGDAKPLTYSVRGQILEVQADGAAVTVAHEAIPGFMPAMVMPFSIRNPEELVDLGPGVAVDFEFVVEQDASFARGFRAIPSGALRLPEGLIGEASKPAAKPRRVDVGDRVPEVELVDQSGKPIALADPERYTVMTFIFTRCPVPEFCPLMSNNFQDIQNAVAEAGMGAEVRLLSVTLDPAFDTPDILRQYGQAVGADFSAWAFATGNETVVQGVADSFRVYRERDGVRLDHTLCTVLIAPDGEIVEIWRGNAWQSIDVVKRLHEVVPSQA